MKFILCYFSLFILTVIAELDISIGSNLRHEKKSVGMYKTKEEVERPPIADHPCNLTRTAVKISFPAMKDEVFVNFLGYREPNLQYVLRCKGLCGDDTSSSQTACVPTKVVKKKVNMMIKSHLQGRDEKERWQEVELEEHAACGCGCEYGSAEQCS